MKGFKKGPVSCLKKKFTSAMRGGEAVASGNGTGKEACETQLGVLKRNILNREPWQKKHSRWHWQDQEYSVVMMIERTCSNVRRSKWRWGISIPYFP